MGCADEQLPAASGKVEDGIRIKFLCSHGGKILPKPDGQLRYVGGDTRLVSFSKSITFADLSSKLEKLFGPNLCLKYQLPSEDLDTLISVTCDDDVENLVEEYDKNEARDGASRLRAFLFPQTGASVTDSNPCTCNTVDDAKGLMISSSHPQVADCTFPASAMFQMPDYLFGLENACVVHGCRQQHPDGDNQLSPRPLVDDKGFFMKSLRPISPTATPREYSRQQFIDSGGRGPALTTSALGPLVSNHHHMWDRRKFWDEGVLVNQRGDEKRHMDLNMEALHHNYQQDVGNGVSMVRVSSKDRLVPSFMEVSCVDSLSVFDRQPRPQTIPRADVHPDVVEDSRQDGHYQGNARHYKPPDVQRAPATASEMLWGLPQPVSSAFHTGGERSTESRRNSGDSDEGSHRKLEGHSGADGLPHSLPVIVMADVPHGLKMPEAYRHEDPVAKQQLRHAEFEQVQYDHFHHMGKGHSQAVHWQLHEPQEQQQHQISMLEPVRIGYNSHGIQRHGQSLEYHAPAAAHHHHMICPPNSIRSMPRPDASSITRLPSPLYRQAASASAPRVDPPSPRRGQGPSSGSHFTSRHGVWVLQKHEMNYLPLNKAQHPSGLPGNQAFMNALEQPCLYDQNGGQAHLTDKGNLANLDAPISQSQYFDKMVLSNPDGTIGQVHCDDDLQYGCMSNNHEVQGIPS